MDVNRTKKAPRSEIWHKKKEEKKSSFNLILTFSSLVLKQGTKDKSQTNLALMKII